MGGAAHTYIILVYIILVCYALDIIKQLIVIIVSWKLNFSYKNVKAQEFALKLLREADIFIKDIHVNYEEKEMDGSMIDMFVPPLARVET